MKVGMQWRRQRVIHGDVPDSRGLDAALSSTTIRVSMGRGQAVVPHTHCACGRDDHGHDAKLVHAPRRDNERDDKVAPVTRCDGAHLQHSCARRHGAELRRRRLARHHTVHIQQPRRHRRASDRDSNQRGFTPSHRRGRQVFDRLRGLQGKGEARSAAWPRVGARAGSYLGDSDAEFGGLVPRLRVHGDEQRASAKAIQHGVAPAAPTT